LKEPQGRFVNNSAPLCKRGVFLIIADSSSVTILAVYRFVFTRLERHRGFLAAGSAHRGVCLASFLPVAAAVPVSGLALFADCAAFRAAARIVCKTLFSEKLLLRNSESKILAAVAAGQCSFLEQ